MNLSYLTPDEARTVFNEWIIEQSKGYTDPNNARFQIIFDKIFEDKDIIRGLML